MSSDHDPEPYLPGGETNFPRNTSPQQGSSDMEPQHTDGTFFTRFLPDQDLIIENKTSEPRDLLMSERTFLSWIKCGVTLMLVAALVVLNFRLDTADAEEDDGDNGSDETTGANSPSRRSHSFGVSVLLICLGIGCYLFAGTAYFQALNSYRTGRIQLYDTKYLTLYLAVLCVTLFAISVYFMVTSS